MITILWEYEVRGDRIAAFKQMYGPGGKWAELFENGKGFLGTTLIQSQDHPQRFTTIDQWESLNDYKTFLALSKEEYDRLDRQCEGLTERESYLGTFGTGLNDEG